MNSPKALIIILTTYTGDVQVLTRHEGRRSGLTAEESLGQTLRQTVAPVGQTNSPGFLVQFRYSWSPKDAVLKGFWKESNAEGAVESIGSPYRAVSSVGRASAF